MSLYNAYSSTITSSYSPSNSKYTSIGYVSSTPVSYRYKPSTYSSTLSSKYSSPTSYTSPSYTSNYSRQLPTSYLSTRVPKFTSVSSYSNAISKPSDWKWKNNTTSRSSVDTGNDYLLKSPTISRRDSSSTSTVTLPRLSDRSPRSSLSTNTSVIGQSSTYRGSTWSQQLLDDDEDKSATGVGLNNLGNTCFMNAVLQCLCHTQSLVDYCTRGSFTSDINHRSPSHGDLMRAFAEFVKAMSQGKSKSPISPYNLRREVQKYAPRFSGDNQQDAQEFLRYLLQGLHDDINRVRYKSSYLSKDDHGGDSTSSWRKYHDTDDSVIVDLFAGQLKSTLKCTVCNNASITYDPFWDLSLPIPEGASSTSLRQCFNLFSSPEYLDGLNKPVCEVCKKKTISSKQMEVNKFPKILVIHFKRFSSTYCGQKLNMMVECPLTLGNVSDLTPRNGISNNCTYTLYGVVDHDGSNNSGHYTAKCKNMKTKEWNEFNDTRVTKAGNIVSNKNYILFYIQEMNSRL